MKELLRQFRRGPIFLGRIRNVPVRLEPTTLIWIAFLTIVAGPWLAPIVFASVLFHEFAHIKMARKYGCEPVDVVLSPVGGAARFRRLPSSPKQEFWIALVGPLASLGLFAVILPVAWLMASWAPFIATPFLVAAVINLMLGVFNLLPVFPMDGGRMLRAFLVHKHGKVRGMELTRKTAVVVAAITALLFFGNGIFFGGLIMTAMFLLNLRKVPM